MRALLTAGGLVAALTVLPLGVAAADPLPSGEYLVDVEGTSFTVSVDQRGLASVIGSDVTVAFSFDETGRVLDEFVVTTADGTFEVDIDVDGDGYTTEVEPAGEDDRTDDGSDDDRLADDATGGETADDDATDDEGDGDDGDGASEGDGSDDVGDDAAETHGEVVSAVARCAPSGAVAREAGLPSHGAVVSAVARGEVLVLELPSADGTTTAVEFDVATPADAAELCTTLDDAVTAAADRATVGDEAPPAGRGQGGETPPLDHTSDDVSDREDDGRRPPAERDPEEREPKEREPKVDEKEKDERGPKGKDDDR